MTIEEFNIILNEVLLYPDKIIDYNGLYRYYKGDICYFDYISEKDILISTVPLRTLYYEYFYIMSIFIFMKMELSEYY